MDATTTQHGNWCQSRVTLTADEWPDYQMRLIADRTDGWVIGWTTMVCDNGNIMVIVTHIGGQL